MKKASEKTAFLSSSPSSSEESNLLLITGPIAISCCQFKLLKIAHITLISFIYKVIVKKNLTCLLNSSKLVCDKYRASI